MLTLAVLAAVVASAVIAAHWTALGAKALNIDDVEYLTENPLVQSPSWDSARRFLTEVSDPSSVKGYYQPLNMISLMLDCAMGGSPREQDLWVFHRSSLVIHAANTLLLMLLLYLLFGNPWAAGAAALLFGVHPMTVETIPWIGERKTLLAAFFALISLILYVQHARKAGRASWMWLSASAAAYVLAVMSKPTAILLPAAMLLFDFWPLDRLFRKPIPHKGRTPPAPPSGRSRLQTLDAKVLLEKVPFFAIAAASAIVTYISQAKLVAETRTPLQALLIFCHNVIFYPYKMLWPVGLSSHYPYPNPIAIGQPAVLAGVIGTLILLAALAVSLRWTRAAAAGWAVFLVLIFPTMGVIGFSNVIASDKFAYLPVVGLLTALAYFAARLWERRRAAVVRAAVICAVLLLAGAEAFLTRRYLAAWRDTFSLYRHMIACAPHSAMLHNNFGRFVEMRGEELMRKSEDKLAASRDPKARLDDRARSRLAEEAADDANEALGCFREARSHFQSAVLFSVPAGLVEGRRALTQAEAAGLSEYGDALVNLGKAVFLDAHRALQAAMERDPGNVRSPQVLRAARERESAAAEAEAMFRRALELSRGTDFSAAANMGGIAWMARGDANAAIGWFITAIRLNEHYAEGRLNLAILLEARNAPGDLAEARRHLRQACRERPSDPRLADHLRRFEARHP